MGGGEEASPFLIEGLCVLRVGKEGEREGEGVGGIGSLISTQVLRSTAQTQLYVRVIFDQENGMRNFPEKGGALQIHAPSPRHHFPFTK